MSCSTNGVLQSRYGCLGLAVAHFDKLCKNTAISMASGILEIGPIWSALGREKATALHVFHAFTGADNVGRFSGLGKTKWFQQYMRADKEVISALLKLTEEGDVTQDVRDVLSQFVCSLYCPKGINITKIPDLRWHLFCKYLAESTKLPPTVGSLTEHIDRVHVQARVWSQATEMWQHLLDPLTHGYYQDDNGTILPTTTKVPPAPQAIVELVRCQCKGQCKGHCTTQNMYIMAAILKIQDGGLNDVCANANIDFWMPYGLRIRKMYRFANLQRF